MPTHQRSDAVAAVVRAPALAGGRTGDGNWTARDLETFLVDAVARELGRRFGGNPVLNRLEAASLLDRRAVAAPSSDTNGSNDIPRVADRGSSIHSIRDPHR